MKNWLWLFFIPSLLVAQISKPRSPITPQAPWSTDLFRAYILSPDDSTNGSTTGGVNDWSPIGVNGNATNAAGWTNQGDESPGFSCSAGIYIFGDSLNGLGITDQLTIVQRLKVTCAGACWGSLAYTDHVGCSPCQSFYLDDIDTDADASTWNIDNGGGLVTVSAGDLGNTNDLITIIATYDGDSIRVYLNGTYKAGEALTGNLISTSAYDLRLGLSYVGGSFRQWTGVLLATYLWKRVLSDSERNAIVTDPYVMFRAETYQTSDDSFYRRRLQ